MRNRANDQFANDVRSDVHELRVLSLLHVSDSISWHYATANNALTEDMQKHSVSRATWNEMDSQPVFAVLTDRTI
jgi:hypothetical protein